MFERIKQVIIKELIQVFRDKRMKAIIFITPLMQLLAFGYAVTTDVNNIQTAVYDMDKSYESRELIRRLGASGYFTISHFVSSPEEIRYLLDRGAVTTAIQIKHGFSSDLKKRMPAEIQILVDGTDSNTGTVAMDYAAKVITNYAKDIGRRNINQSLLNIDLRTRAWYNPDLKSRNYNVPGVIAIVIMLTCLLLTSMAVVRERELGTMEQLMVTPLRPVELMLGKTIPFGAIGLFDMLLVTVAGVFWFNIPVKGALQLMPVSTVIYLFSVLGIGLLISTFSRTQQQALMTTFLFYIPAVLLSGFMFPLANMPKLIQYATYVNPLRYFLVIIRGIFLKGNGYEMLWPQLAALFVLGAGFITLSSLRFRKKLG